MVWGEEVQGGGWSSPCRMTKATEEREGSWAWRVVRKVPKEEEVFS